MEPTRPVPARPPAPALPRHLERLALIERGGMGEVWRVRDHLLDRELALKVAHPHIAEDALLLGRFQNEARITARLDHPGVVPVHEAGLLPDGRPYFTMRRMRGGTLRTYCGGVALARRVEVFERVCLIVAYAHDRGIIHADLKPENVMVGEFGEVVVLDWGIARHVDDPPDTEGFGTPAYLAPDAPGEGPGRPEDVYALGVTFREMLTGRLPGDEVGDECPPALLDIARSALGRRDLRPTAAGLATELVAWRDRSRRRQEAEELVALAAPLAREAMSLREEADRLSIQGALILDPLGPDAPESARLPAWELAARAEALRTQAEIGETRFVEGLQAALRLDDELAAAREPLASHHQGLLLAAEERGDTAAAARARVSFETYARGELRAWLDTPSVVTIDSMPDGAQVRASRWEPRFGRHERVDHGPIGVTPLTFPLERGSWMLTIEHGSFAPAQVPVVTRRGERVDLGAVRLLTECPPSDCYIPAGPFRAGGDPDAPDSIAGRILHVDGFVMRRHPVSNAEFLAFLNDLWVEGRQDLAEAVQPVQTDGRGQDGVPVFLRDAAGRFLLGAAADGIPWEPEWPICLVTWHAARAYAAWEAQRSGLPWRLPDEWEWEKAARGGDARRYPWGVRCDPAWACTQLSHGDRPQRTSVYDFPQDESPYGVRGLGGNIRDWCLNAYGRAGPEAARVVVGQAGSDTRWRVTRGGAWNSAPAFCLSAARFTTSPGRTATTVGFRLTRSVDPVRGNTTTPPG